METKRTATRKPRKKKSTISITKILFLTTQLFVFVWISISYMIAIYATVKLKQPFPVVELSGQAMGVILGNVGMKTVSNIFEHNDGVVFGKSVKDSSDTNSKPTI